VLPGFCHNLAIRHLVNRFDANDTAAELFAFKSFSKLDLRFTRTEY
jgi:hypothetical protein